MVEHQPSKLDTRVRFPSPAPASQKGASSEYAPVAQLVRAPDCGSGCRGFESLYPPHKKPGLGNLPIPAFLFPIQGCSQAVRQGTLTPSLAGSSPAIPATSSRQSPLRSERPGGHSSLLSLASPLQTAIASLDCSLVISFSRKIPIEYDSVAQSVEQLPFKPWVRGSSPRWVTKTRKYEHSSS